MKIFNYSKKLIVGVIFCSAILLSIHPSYADSDKHESEEEGQIKLSPEQIEFAGIGLSQATSGNIREILPLYGQVVTNDLKVHSLKARFDGEITKINKQIGDSVNKGEVLAWVESNDSLKDYAIKSSISGVVIERNVNVGEQTSDDTLFKVADYSSVWADLSAFPMDLKKIHLGQKTRIKHNTSDIAGEGHVIYISPFGNNNQTTKVRVLLENPEYLFIPGRFITAEINLAEIYVDVAIRNEGIQILDDTNVVFVQEGNVFEPREVILGRTDGEIIEVLAGLNLGETYVTKNSFILKAEAGKGDIEDDD